MFSLKAENSTTPKPSKVTDKNRKMFLAGKQHDDLDLADWLEFCLCGEAL